MIIMFFLKKRDSILSFFVHVLFFFRITVERGFTVDDEITRQYRRFNAVGTQLTVRLLPPSSDDGNPELIS